MANLNKVFLIGRLTRDPELRYLPNGTPVARFGLATSYTAGEEEKPCFVDVSLFGKQGEVLAEYCAKGREVFLEGRLDFRAWETPDRQKRSRLSVVAQRFQFLGGRKGKGAGEPAAAAVAAGGEGGGPGAEGAEPPGGEEGGPDG